MNNRMVNRLWLFWLTGLVEMVSIF